VRRLFVLIASVLALVVGLSACKPAPPKVGARGGTGQITVTAEPNAQVALYDHLGHLVPTYTLPTSGDPILQDFRRVDANGFLVLRYIPTGYGYVVRRVDDNTTLPSDPVTVGRVLSRPKQSIYSSQKLNIGYGYLKTRDGTLLSTMVRLPGPADKGPYPTIVEYSGYDPSNPDWSGTAASTHIASNLGFAVVGVNIRGTGCSGGSFNMWEDAQATDGYDAVETVAAQPWVQDHKVALAGLSYPGQGALYASSTQPPHLEAIAVGGTYDDGFRDLLRPSGILNNGFARDWIRGRYAEAQPAGQAWTKALIDKGDKVCAYNQLARSQNVDLTSRIDTDQYFPTTFHLGDTFAPQKLVGRIKVPVFMVATWQDEQVGGHAPTMIPDFTGTTKKHFMLTNGGHAEMFAVPEIIQRWGEFLDFYVKHKVPDQSVLKAIAPYVAQQVVGGPDQIVLPFPADRYTGKTYAQALAAYEAEPQVRVVFENGAGTDGVAPGLPHPSFEKDFTAYPIPGTQVARYYLGPDGALTAAAPTAADDAADTIDSYVSDPSVRPRSSSTGGNDWGQFPPFNWKDPVAGDALSYVSPALATDTTMIGSASVDLWLKSSSADTDLQATLTEVRPDGKETYVQTGWLRASARKLDARSTELQPLTTMLAGDAAPLPAGEFTPVRLEIYPFAHVFRAGSKFRLIITAPGGDRIAWGFATFDDKPTNEIGRSAGRPSSIALPVVPGISPPAGLPACPGLRGQPCRDYAPFTNITNAPDAIVGSEPRG
jgi:predicted acyl esterase